MPTAHLRSSRIAWMLQIGLVMAYCAWVLSMPVFPSQDGPLHLYCVEVFRQLLFHRPGVYSETYYISRYLPPYSLYYYGLVALGRVVTLEMADKIIVCSFFVVFLLGVRSLMRTVSGKADWAPLLVAPVLLSWPLVMGFVNFCIATGFACFALSSWCRNQGRPGFRARLPFLLWLAAILLTHPVPWMFVLAFCFFDLGVRLIRFRKAEDPLLGRALLGHFRADLAVTLAGCLGYLYLRRFPAKLPARESYDPGPVPYVHQIGLNVVDYLRTRGLTVFTGVSGWALVSRLGVTLMFAAAMITATVFAARSLRSRQWNWPMMWVTFAALFAVVLPFVPVTLNGSFYFAWRLMLLLYLSVAVAASGYMASAPRVGIALAIFAVVSGLLNLGLAFQRISPTARAIASLDEAPLIRSEKPGLLTQPLGVSTPPGIAYNPEFWAGAMYFRHHNLLMFNTGWMNIEIIPIKPRPGRLHTVDDTYFIVTPMPGNRLFLNPEAARETLDRVGFVVTMRVNAPTQQSPFASTIGSSTPDSWAADWSCVTQPDFHLCTPPGAMVAAVNR